jgi:hypothetical protein
MSIPTTSSVVALILLILLEKKSESFFEILFNELFADLPLPSLCILDFGKSANLTFFNLNLSNMKNILKS